MRCFPCTPFMGTTSQTGHSRMWSIEALD